MGYAKYRPFALWAQFQVTYGIIVTGLVLDSLWARFEPVFQAWPRMASVSNAIWGSSRMGKWFHVPQSVWANSVTPTWDMSSFEMEKIERWKESTWHQLARTATPRASESWQRVVSCYGTIGSWTPERASSSRRVARVTSKASKAQGNMRSHERGTKV
jgi:hypothetical protein